MREMRNACRIFVAENLKGRSVHRWKENIIMNLRQIWCDDVDWIHLAQDRGQWPNFVKRILNFLIPERERSLLDK
jgi:hypothetical protein